MVYKKLAVSGIAGVLVACLIIASVRILPLFKLATHELPKSELLAVHGVLSESPQPGRHILNVSFILYEFTEPLGPGSEANLTVTMTPNFNETDVVAMFNIEPSSPPRSKGISFADGHSKWIWVGDLEANVSKALNVRLKANEVGFAVMRGYVSWWRYYDPEEPHFGLLHGGYLRLGFTVLENNTLAATYPRYPWPTVNPWIVAGPNSGWESHANFELHRMTYSTPVGVGSEADMNFSLYAQDNLTDATLKILLPEGIELVEGETTWTGNIPRTFNNRTMPLDISIRIRTTKLGAFPIVAYLEKDKSIISDISIFEISVFEDETIGCEIILY